jgi:DNA polymerase-3 subunit epsilon
MDMLKDAPTYPEIATDLIARTQGRTIICYNAEYDSQLLRQTAQINGGRVPSSRWECVMLQYARFRGEWNFSRRDYRWHRLPGADHTALGDCRATLALVYQMARAQKLKRWYEFWVDSE